jgi:putative ABC transport system permease protein
LNLRYLIKEFRRHSWRTVAGISGYIIASLFILLILSVTQANEKDSFGILKGTGTHFIVYIPSNISCCVSCDNDGESKGGSLFAEGVFTLMLTSDLISSIKKIDGVKDAAPYLLYKLFDEKLKVDISLGGIDTSSTATKNNVCAASDLIAGKFLFEKPDEVVAEESFAVAHRLSVGNTLDVYGGRLRVAGIINSGIKPGKADLYAPIENVRAILKVKLNCLSPGFDMNIVVVEVTDARLQKRIIGQLKKEMNYLSVSSYNCYEPAGQVMTIIEKTTKSLSFLIFLFLIIFSTRTQLTALMERSREIGILKSLGWSDFRLSTQILSGSIIQSLIGVAIGCLFGVFVILFINSNNIMLFGLVKFHLKFSSIPALILLSVTGGILAAFFPIIKLYNTKAGDMINNYL